MGSGQKSLVDRGVDWLTEGVSESGHGIYNGVTGLLDTASDGIEAGWDTLKDTSNSFLNDRMAEAAPEAPQDTDPWSDAFLGSRMDWRYEDGDGKDLTGSDHLVDVMNTLSAPRPDGDDPEALEAWKASGRDAALQLNHLRGSPQSEELAIHEYNRFRYLQEEAAKAVDAEPGQATPALDPERHPDHMGSIQQLRYGSYVGEALDVDPVYGALLNPTGGLVGPGNDSIAAPADSYGSFHGEAHDAFGYLATHHDAGPGYMYGAPSEAAAFGDTDLAAPLTGQHSGFDKWHGLFQERGYREMSHQGVEREMDQSVSGIVNQTVEHYAGRDPGVSVAEHLGPLPKAVEATEDLLHLGGAALDWITGGD